MDDIKKRIENLRREMRAESIDIIIFPSTDPHNSEYPPSHWQARKWISGFTGSAGTVVITLTGAALWVDSRYYIQAAEQLRGSGIQLMRDGLEDTPSMKAWIARRLSVDGGTIVSVDGSVMSFREVSTMQQELRRLGGITVRTNYDGVRMLWRDRPQIPSGAIRIQAPEHTGESSTSKLRRIREALRAERCTAHLTTELMNIAWVTNLRGCDVQHTPVFVSFLYVDMQRAVLFCSENSLTTEASRQLKESGITTRPYDSIAAFLSTETRDEKVLCDASVTCYTLYNIIKDRCKDGASPIAMMKAVKNSDEIRGFRKAMVRDGVAMVKWLRWLRSAVEQGGQTELSVSERLESLRAESKEFEELSFGTIAGYNAHGAIVHYEATADSNASLRPEGLLLVDSGAQYSDGTTDITRTIALGSVTEEMRLVYTLVLKANIALARLQFPDGTTGTQIDAVAHSVVWSRGYNYLHGTGHGVGSHLAVHEGPHAIRMNWVATPLRAGMTITDEPGVYLENRFGVRIENTMLVVPGDTTECGRFLRLEPLTLCPIDLSPVKYDMLSTEEMEWLNAYHAHVREQLMPHLNDTADRKWLDAACRPVGR